MKALEKLRGDEDQDVRYFAGAKSFEEVSIFSDDATKNDGHSSEEFDDENHNERAESEEKGAFASNTGDTVLIAPLSTTIDNVQKDDYTNRVNDEKLENEIENMREELQSTSIVSEVADERLDREDSSLVIAQDLLNNLIDTIETKWKVTNMVDGSSWQ